MQHISTFARPDGGGAWAYSFTQEWPLRGMRHQLSYTVPVQHDEAERHRRRRHRASTTGTSSSASTAVGSTWRPARRCSCPPATSAAAAAPAASGSRPTCPLSIRPAPRSRCMPTPAPPGPRRPRALWAPSPARWTPTLGGSAIWLLRPSFNLLSSSCGYSTESVVAPDDRGPAGYLARQSGRPVGLQLPEWTADRAGRGLHDRPRERRRRGRAVPLPELRASVRAHVTLTAPSP